MEDIDYSLTDYDYKISEDKNDKISEDKNDKIDILLSDNIKDKYFMD